MICRLFGALASLPVGVAFAMAAPLHVTALAVWALARRLAGAKIP